MKKIITLVLGVVMSLSLVACGDTETKPEAGNNPTQQEQSKEDNKENIEGNMQDTLKKVLEEADLDADLREAFNYYDTIDLTSENVENFLGTSDIKFAEAVNTQPKMSSVAFQMVLLRTEEGADVEAVKNKIKENIDPRKWVCVEPEVTIVENVGDVILMIMSEEATGNAIKESFMNLAK